MSSAQSTLNVTHRVDTAAGKSFILWLDAKATATAIDHPWFRITWESRWKRLGRLGRTRMIFIALRYGCLRTLGGTYSDVWIERNMWWNFFHIGCQTNAMLYPYSEVLRTDTDAVWTISTLTSSTPDIPRCRQHITRLALPRDNYLIRKAFRAIMMRSLYLVDLSWEARSCSTDCPIDYNSPLLVL